MKKLVFLFAMVFAVGMVMAQNTAVVTQSGGNSNTAYTQQVGDGNDIFISQALATATEYNVAGVSATDRIFQKGDNNIAKLEQIVKTTWDNASSNEAKIVQKGDGNKLAGADDDAHFNVSKNAIQDLDS